MSLTIGALLQSSYLHVLMVISAPLARSASQRIGPLGTPRMAVARAIGLECGVVLVVPGVGALALAALLHVPMGTMLLRGELLIIPTILISVALMTFLFRNGFWNAATDETAETHRANVEADADADARTEQQIPAGQRASARATATASASGSDVPTPTATATLELVDLLGERPLVAGRVVAEEPSELKVDRRLLPADCGVGESSAVPAVHSRRGVAAPRALRGRYDAPSGDTHRSADPDDAVDHDRSQVREEHFQQIRRLIPHLGGLPKDHPLHGKWRRARSGSGWTWSSAWSGGA
ncbi:hypothetical protein ACIPM2_32910 [Streptomyces sp. NPDC086081]|uniref:GntT/GntP/DsdX family permease n=1 Tax=Streptomyces sp. NPDC086081 TaxID=3365749 RepID=UPI003816BA21